MRGNSLTLAVSHLLIVLLTAFPVAPVAADWVYLKDGARLRGVELKRRGKDYTFLLEDGRRILIRQAQFSRFEESSPGETVRFRGEQVPLRQKIHALRVQRKKRDLSILRDIERVARYQLGTKKSQKKTPSHKVARSRARLRGLSPKAEERHYSRALVSSRVEKARRFAATELSRFKSRRAVRALAMSAVIDPDKEVRSASLESLGRINRPEVAAGSFVSFLGDRNVQHRIRAAGALERFPSQRAVAPLINTFKLVWAGFGRGFTFQGTQRAYINDYELVSGGTGFAIIEVADPVVTTLTTGVVLDVDVQKVEATVRRRVLRQLTGQDFGTDVARWQRWLQNQKNAGGTRSNEP